jgi:glycosyltransferase involved in cell wall biosynthesis
MKVLQVNPYPPDHLGGSEIFCKNLSINLKKKKNIETEILTSDIFKRKIKNDLIEELVPVHYKKFYFNLWGKNPVVNVYNFIRKNYQKYDIIHTHSYIFFTSLQCALLRKLRKFNLILHIHGGVQTPLGLNSNFKEYIQLLIKSNIFDVTIGKFVIENSDHIISVSLKDLNVISDRFDLSQKSKHYIPNAVDISKFQRNEKLNRKYITYIGRLSYIKGIDVFLKMIREIHQLDKNLEFLIIGDGPLRPLVENAKKYLPITYYRQYPYSKIQNIYNMSKLLMITSRFEGLPTSILESLACETPVVASDVGGISEVLINEKNGILFNLNNQDKIINQNSKLENMGKNGRKIIEKNHSWQVVIDQILRVYEQALKS